jgi:hypothetical protein
VGDGSQNARLACIPLETPTAGPLIAHHTTRMGYVSLCPQFDGIVGVAEFEGIDLFSLSSTCLYFISNALPEAYGVLLSSAFHSNRMRSQ